MKLFIVLFIASCIWSKCFAETLTYVVGLSKPPYVFQSDNNGYELETVTHINRLMGFSTKFVYVPFGRTPMMLDNEFVDGILTVNEKIIDKPSHLTQSYITYQNVVVTRKLDNFSIARTTDLANLSVAAFQNSSHLLGSEYAKAVEQSPYYTEIPDQLRQVELLREMRVQALVIDVNIFKHYASSFAGSELADYSIHFIFPPSHYALAFKDKSRVAKFNDALKLFKNSPQFETLREKYRLGVLEQD